MSDNTRTPPKHTSLVKTYEAATGITVNPLRPEHKLHSEDPPEIEDQARPAPTIAHMAIEHSSIWKELSRQAESRVTGGSTTPVASKEPGK